MERRRMSLSESGSWKLSAKPKGSMERSPQKYCLREPRNDAELDREKERRVAALHARLSHSLGIVRAGFSSLEK